MRSDQTRRMVPKRYGAPAPIAMVLDFIAVVQIGPGTQTTRTVCPFGDGHDGRTCAQQP